MSILTSRATDVTATGTSGANASADITIAADTNTSIYLTHLSAGYDVNTGFGTVTLKSGATTVFVIPVHTISGTVVIDFASPLKFPRGVAVTATISAGGGTTTGTVNLAGYRL